MMTRPSTPGATGGPAVVHDLDDQVFAGHVEAAMALALGGDQHHLA